MAAYHPLAALLRSSWGVVMAFFGAVEDDGVSVSVVGLIVGLVLAVLIYMVGDWLSRREGHSAIRIVALILAVLVFLLLGFNLY